MPSILFVCTANQFRSPLAAACLTEALRVAPPAGEWTIESAGTWAAPGLPAPEFTRQAARRLGLPGLEQHRTRPVEQALLSKFDLVIVMESGHKEALGIEFPFARKRIHLLSEIVDGKAYDIPDPDQPGVDPLEVAQEIQTLIRQGADKITRLAATLAARP